jgi:hypothetical protein
MHMNVDASSLLLSLVVVLQGRVGYLSFLIWTILAVISCLSSLYRLARSPEVSGWHRSQLVPVDLEVSWMISFSEHRLWFEHLMVTNRACRTAGMSLHSVRQGTGAPYRAGTGLGQRTSGRCYPRG